MAQSKSETQETQVLVVAVTGLSVLVALAVTV
jgi:hypothetical protein